MSGVGKPVPGRLSAWLKQFGYRQVPAWYATSRETIDEFDTIGKKLRILKLIPNPFPFYDWIMGFYERPSDREALAGPVLERSRRIIDVGAGTGYLLSRLLKVTREDQEVAAVDLSQQMLANGRAYLAKHGQLTPRVMFQQADCRSLPWPDNSFDLYVSSYLFDLLPEDELAQALREMERVLVPDGYAILITMTTELDGLSRFRKLFYRLMNEFYCLGYHRGRWNPIWKFLFAGYAPHCRPIALGSYLRQSPHMLLAYTKLSRVSLFPVRIHYVRKGHG
jgi:ubiquinone/menaquinone biosynthesis C-methylase UbiE